MGSFSDYLENKLLDHVFGGTAYSAPGTLYLGLFTAAPSDSGGGTEVSGNGYARKAVTNNTTNWPNASGGSKAVGAAQEFAAANGGSWGTITHFGIFDASSAGNLLAWGALTASKAIADADVFRFDAGNITITLD